MPGRFVGQHALKDQTGAAAHRLLGQAQAGVEVAVLQPDHLAVRSGAQRFEMLPLVLVAAALDQRLSRIRADLLQWLAEDRPAEVEGAGVAAAEEGIQVGGRKQNAGAVEAHGRSPDQGAEGAHV